jgi:hypothetical protein
MVTGDLDRSEPRGWLSPRHNARHNRVRLSVCSELAQWFILRR